MFLLCVVFPLSHKKQKYVALYLTARYIEHNHGKSTKIVSIPFCVVVFNLILSAKFLISFTVLLHYEIDDKSYP